jgi:hypothetical protein
MVIITEVDVYVTVHTPKTRILCVIIAGLMKGQWYLGLSSVKRAESESALTSCNHNLAYIYNYYI